MKNIYFSELFELAQDFDKFWHRRYYEVNVRGNRLYKNFNDYYQQRLEKNRLENEKYNDPNREISDERRKLIRSLITNEKTINKDGIEFIVFTHKMQRYKKIQSLEELASTRKPKLYYIYNTSVIISCEEKVDDHYETGKIENAFCSIAKTKPKSDRQFKETCELIENSTIEELMEMLRKEFKQSKNVWKKRFEEDLKEKQKMKEQNKKELEEIRRKREMEKSKK